jgi:hypothetical protein
VITVLVNVILSKPSYLALKLRPEFPEGVMVGWYRVFGGNDKSPDCRSSPEMDRGYLLYGSIEAMHLPDRKTHPMVVVSEEVINKCSYGLQ